jgi:hypothetical protein
MPSNVLKPQLVGSQDFARLLSKKAPGPGGNQDRAHNSANQKVKVAKYFTFCQLLCTIQRRL